MPSRQPPPAVPDILCPNLLSFLELRIGAINITSSNFLPVRVLPKSIFFSLLLPSTLFGQAEELPPLVIAGEKPRGEAENLPGHSSSIDARALAAVPSAAATYQDLFATVAGGYAGNPTAGAFNVRGINQDSLFYAIGTGANPLISVLEDGAPLSSNTLRYLPPTRWDLESAELLRGPQFLAPGPNALGGALLLHTKSATFSNHGNALLEAAEKNTFRSGVSQDFLLLPDELALRFSAYHGESDGETTNLYNGDKSFGAMTRDRYQARLLWYPAKNRDARFDLSLVHDQSDGTPYGSAREIKGLGLFDRKTDVNLKPSYPAERSAAALNATFALPNDLELKSTTTFQLLNVDSTQDIDSRSDYDWYALGAIDELRFTQDLTLADREGAFQWLIGGYLEASEYDLHYVGSGFSTTPAGAPFESLGQEDAHLLALYGRGDWEWVQHFHLTGGLRLQREQRDLQTAATMGTAREIRSATGRSGTELLPQLGVAWSPQKDQTVGLQLSRGVHSGGVSYAPTLGSTQPYDPEHAWELELYNRARPLDSLALSAALFHSWFQDQQINYNPEDPKAIPTIDSYIANAASSRRFGGELEARWQLLDTLTFTSTLAWIHTEFCELSIDGIDHAGQSFPNAPEWLGSLTAAYHHPSGLFSSVLMSWADATYSDVASPDVTHIESRQLLSARIGYEWHNANVYLFGSNLLNDEYAISRFDNSRLLNPAVSGQVGPSRAFGIGCEFKW